MSSIEPLVVAVPVFNAERYLAATLQSLNAQGEFARWWLQDGGSRDATMEIAGRYTRSGDQSSSESDRGQADALNKAFSRMGGSIIGFLNGDDTLKPGTAERVLQFFRENPSVDLLYGSVEWIDASGDVTGMHCGRIDSLAEVLDIYNVWWKGRQWVQPEVFFRRSLLEKAGGFDTRLHLAFDYDFWVRCLMVGARVAHAPGVVAQFRLHPDQKSSETQRAADEIRTTVLRHLAGAPIGGWRKTQIRAALSYDLYQLGRGAESGTLRKPFLSELLRHPTWWLATAVR